MRVGPGAISRLYLPAARVNWGKLSGREAETRRGCHCVPGTVCGCRTTQVNPESVQQEVHEFARVPVDPTLPVSGLLPVGLFQLLIVGSDLQTRVSRNGAHGCAF